MIWLIATLISLFTYACSHLVDSHLANQKFTHSESVFFFASVFNLLWLPVLYFTGEVKMIGTDMVVPFLIIGACEIGYLFPYYRSQQLADASIVSSLFIFKRFFLPVVAYFMLREELTQTQYTGLIILLIAVVLAQGSKLRADIPTKVILLMMVASFLLTFQEVIVKSSIDSLDWITVSFWAGVVTLFGNLLLLFSSPFRRRIVADGAVLYGAIRPLLLGELFSLCGLLSAYYALSLQSVTIVSSFYCFTGFATLSLSWMLHKLFPGAWRESHDLESTFRKIFFFSIMVVGGVLLAQPN